MLCSGQVQEIAVVKLVLFFFVDLIPLGHHLESVHIILHKEKEKRLVNDATAFTMIYVWWMC